MKNVLLLGITILAVVVLTVLGTLAVVKSVGPPPLTVQESVVERPAQHGQLPDATAQSKDSERVDAASTEPDSALESISVAELLPSRLPTEEEIAAKYTSFEGEEFVGLFRARHMFYTQLADVIAKRKITTGDCATKIIESSEPFGPILGEESWPGDLPPVDGLSVQEIGDGLLEVRHAQVFPDEDPKLHGLYVEVQWLQKQAAPYQ